MRDTLQRIVVKEEKGRGYSLVPAVSLLFGLLVIVGVGAGLWSVTADQESTPAPRELAGYRLVEAVVGPEAIDEINRLHGTGIEIVDAWIGRYQGGGGVWVSQASSGAKARELLDEMVTNIQDGGSPFRGLTRQEFQGMPLYSVRDSRLVHYFYQTGTQVVWVATPPGDEENFLSATFRKVG